MNELNNAQPIYFGPASRALFGWVHHPRAGVPKSDMGLVLCNAFGYEEICSHRTLRHTAMTAAQFGISCIRFDYDGTGNSIGDDFDSGRVEAWIGSIHAAVDELKARTGVTRICLLGVRMGGLLAATVAKQRSDICGLALILPTVKPRSYLRELRALHIATLNMQPEDPGDGDASLTESVGFVMTADTTRALEQLSCAGSIPPAPDILIVDRTDLPNSRILSEQLQEQGARVNYVLMADQELLSSTLVTQLPAQILESCCKWMGELSARGYMQQPEAMPGREQSRYEARTRMPLAGGTEESPDFIEEVAEHSATTGRFSITTLPPRNHPGRALLEGRRGILLLNSGAIHHTGPSGMYVTLARHWASMGYVVTRVDLSGIGESPALAGMKENDIYPDLAADDVHAALSHMKERHGVTEAVCAGICSGAFHSFVAATKGLPLKGVILINPLVYYLVEGAPIDAHELLPRAAFAAMETKRLQNSALKWSAWKRLFTGKADLPNVAYTIMFHAVPKLRALHRDALRMIGISIPNDLPGDLRRLEAKGVKTMLVFGSLDLGLWRTRNQGGYALRRLIRRNKVELHVVHGADHIFLQLKHRRVLQRLLSDGIRAMLPG